MKQNGLRILCSILLTVAIATTLSPQPLTRVHAAATAIQIQAPRYTILVGEKLSCKLIGTTKKVTWSVSPKEYATINQSTGQLTAKKAGSVTVSAKTAQGNYKLTVIVTSSYELNDAVLNGFVPLSYQQKYDANITYKEYCTIMRSMLKKYNPSLIKAWDKMVGSALTSKKVMKREDALLLNFMTAKMMGINVYNTHEAEGQYKLDKAGAQLSYGYPFVGWDKEASLYFEDGLADGDPFQNHALAAIYYNVRRESLLTNQIMITAKNGDFQLNRPLNMQDAILAVERLYDSVLIQNDKAMEDPQIVKLADAKRKAILNDTTEITVKGTTYYVSEAGNDSNDGLSKDTPWQSLNKVSTASLQIGDMVVFQRGGLWRGQLIAQEGVTYSAYGSGEKPRIYGSSENAASPEKWSLLEGSKNIWVYHKMLPDCGSIVFNEGEAAGYKESPYYLNGKYVCEDNLKKAFSIKNNLSHDLSYFTRADSVIKNGVPYLGELSGMEESISVGKLYLRCDKGNPGEVFDSIEISIRQNIIIPAQNAVFNNLCFRYCGGHALFSYGNNLIVQNCEFGWIGGTVQFYDTETGFPMRYGNAIEFDGPYNFCTAKNNYIYQVFDAGLSNQGGKDFEQVNYVANNITYADNLVTNCASSIEIFYDLKREEPVMKNVKIDHNILMYAGTCMIDQRNEPTSTSHIMMWGFDNPSENYVVSNNIFYQSKGFLLHMPILEEYLPVLKNNTYVQPYGQGLAKWTVNDKDTYFYASSQASEIVTKVLGDKTGSVKVLR